MRHVRGIALFLLALFPLVTLFHRDDRGRWDLQRSAMTAPDEFSYLLMAQNFLHGGGLSLDSRLGHDTFYPPGYPLLLAGWAKISAAGRLTALTGHSLNALLLSAAVVIVYFFSRRLLLSLAAAEHRRFSLSSSACANLALLIAALFAANWHVLDSSLVIMSEPAFMLAAFAWLALALRWPDWPLSPLRTAVLMLLAVVAWSIRGAGITCVAATLLFPFLFWLRHRGTFRALPRKRLAAVLAVMLALPLLYQLILLWASPEKSLASGQDSENSYVKQLLRGLTLRSSPGDPLLQVAAAWVHHVFLLVAGHLGDFAESFVPWLREKPDFFFRDLIGKCLLALGLAGFLPHLLRSLSPKNKTAGGFLEIYLLLYITLYLLWPFNMARFWTPVLPMMLAYAAVAVAGMGAASRKIPGAAAGVLLALLLALSLVEDYVQLGNRARRLNYVSDSLRDAIRAIRREDPRPLVAGMTADDLFLAAWNFSQESPEGISPLIHIPRQRPRQFADDMLAELVRNSGGRPVYFLSYFPEGNADTRDTLDGVARQLPDSKITRFFRKEIIISVWKIERRPPS
jgi:hypothetical protein